MTEKDPKTAIWGDQAERIERNLRELDPDLARLILDTAYGDVFARDGLDLKTRELLAVALLTSLGADAELETHVRGALRCGATIAEVRETVLHAAMFVGFPRAVAAMKVVRKVGGAADAG